MSAIIDKVKYFKGINVMKLKPMLSLIILTGSSFALPTVLEVKSQTIQVTVKSVQLGTIV